MIEFPGIKLTLGRKVIDSFLMLGLCIAVGCYATLHLAIFPVFEKFENQQADESLSRFHKAIKQELNALMVISMEYSQWDQTYNYIGGSRPEYVEENLNVELFPMQDINLLLLLDLQANMVWGKVTDQSNENELTLSDQLLQPLLPGHPLLPVEKSIQLLRRKDAQCALCVIDLDGFKVVNDTLGHSIGDLLLQMVSDRVSGIVRAQDTIGVRGQDEAQPTANDVARIGGDEFLILLADFSDTSVPVKVVTRILKEIAVPFNVHGNELHITASIGIALYPEDGDSLEILMRRADSAMYDAKHVGKNSYRYYKKTHEKSALRRLSLEASLRKAIENNELELHYQPQVDIQTGQIVGAEGLLRWRHPREGMISPAEFIPIAEETGLIHPVGEWVLRDAIVQTQKWSNKYPDNFKVSVNVSEGVNLIWTVNSKITSISHNQRP